MADVKNYGLTGIAPNVQFGKAGPRIKATGESTFEARNTADDNLANIKAAPAIASNEVVVKSQLDTLANDVQNISNSVTSTTGFTIALGDVVADGDGSWAPGAVPLTNEVKVASAIDSLNEVLAKLVPAQPPAFPNGSLSVSNNSGSTPLLAAGGVPDNSSSSSLVAGSAVTRLNGTNVSSNTFGDVGPGDAGTISLLMNGTVLGSRVLTGVGDAGTYSGLIIADQKDYPTTTPGFWKSIDVSVSLAAAAQGINKFQLTHSGAGSTSEVYFVKDNLTSVPTITGGSVTETTVGTVAYSSSVPHYDQGATLAVNMSVSNLSGETYYGGSDPLVISGTNSIISSDTKTYADMGITTPITRQTTVATALSPITVAIDGTNIHNVGTLQAVAKNVVGSSSTTSLSSTNILVMRGTTSRIVEMNVPVSGLGALPNSSNAVRVALATGDTPAGSTSAWSSSTALPTYEAAVVAGILGHNKTNYSTGYLPVGPDLSTGRDGAQYATFTFQRSSVSTFKIVVTGTYAGCWVKLPGVSDNASIAPQAPNGWWNAFKLYDGAGVPGESDDSNAGCALGTAMAGASGTYTITFGTQSSTNAAGNSIVVRFKLTTGQTITALSFTN